MSNTAPQLFNNISPAQFAVLQEKASAAGIPISGNSGTAAKMGVEVAWTYTPDSQQLSLHCLKTPFFISTDNVNQKIKDLVTQTLASA
jgi:hypothetical protein